MLDAFSHETGAHCGSTSLFDVATFASWDLPEPVCFGIGGGLGFSYFERERSPSREFVGRTPWLETAFFEHLGVDVDDNRGDDAETAFADLRAYVDGGRPVLAFVDIYHLPYFDSDVHFAPHVVVVVEVDEAGVVVADSEFESLQRVTREDFDAAWSSDVGFYGELDRRRLVFRGEPDATKADAMRAGIRATADGLLRPERAYDGIPDAGTGTNGLDGMRAMARELPEWPEFEDADWCTRFAYQNVEKRGTGGAAFRGLFRPFLETASDVVDEVTEADVDAMRTVEDDWHAIGQSLKRAGLADDADDSRAAYDAASERMLAVAEHEEELFESLDERL
ncbi:BtrH N-terminal domain-containing protein [Halorubellus sp. JP-L1]|uniref:BtrH N-terminal domain-containing protein n=1 Tax=Halorubellus sp. JP-L1 TaxID=2715753 RepID=UPI00140D0F15|nr:BtrH N-terminal domain-containing protein [Halorubellus sp. JP-L1]NHN43265.1 BtrH N-terminal domain-containing protein [Halorubellus sp. JP-L1]